MTPFGVQWQNLALRDLRVFLEGDAEEGITWEAKGGDIRPEHVRRAVAAFANGSWEGYLVLGASRSSSGDWELAGWAPPGGEPDTWLATCLGPGSLRPMPAWHPTSFALGELWVTVIKVQPVPVPPCLTSAGEVLERVSGVSRKVTDPQRLRDLLEAGKAAESRAAMEAREAAAELFRAAPEAMRVVTVVALASPSLSPDVSEVVFRQATYQRLLEILRRGLVSPEFRASINQHGITVWNLEPTRTLVRLRRHGGVAVGLSHDLAGGDLRLRQEELRHLWSTSAELLRYLGTEGDCHVSILQRNADYPGEVEFHRTSTTEGPAESEIQSVMREADRARGSAAWEPA